MCWSKAKEEVTASISRRRSLQSRGIVQYVMRDGTNIPIKADADLQHQIVLCGLSLVHQLVAGEKYKHTLFNSHHYCNDELSSQVAISTIRSSYAA